jgi:hypothetical protein
MYNHNKCLYECVSGCEIERKSVYVCVCVCVCVCKGTRYSRNTYKCVSVIQ